MKLLLVLLFVGLAAATSDFFNRPKRDSDDPTNDDDSCFANAKNCCNGADASNCNFDCSSLILGKGNYSDFIGFANDHLVVSFEYLFLSAQFGTHMKDRPGFEKILHGLADSAWNKGIEMIKESAKRGLTHDFKKTTLGEVSIPESQYELNALAKAAEIEKNLLIRANDIHRHHSHGSVNRAEGEKHGYDAGISHYLEEEIIEGKTQTVRNLVGHVNDLKNLLKKPTDTSTFALSLYLFDQQLQK